MLDSWMKATFAVALAPNLARAVSDFLLLLLLLHLLLILPPPAAAPVALTVTVSVVVSRQLLLVFAGRVIARTC